MQKNKLLLDITNNIEIKKLYKETDRFRKYMCFVWANYYKINYDDLFSQANLIFVNSIYNYIHSQKTFVEYYKNTLYGGLKNYCFNTMYYRTRELKIKNKLKIEYSNIDNQIKIKDKKKDYDSNSEINHIVKEIINFILKPNFMELLKPYIKIKKQNKIKPSAYLIKYYFNTTKGYSHKKLDLAIGSIRKLLREGSI